MDVFESIICKRAVEVFGKEEQLMILFEEMGELMQAISKEKRYKTGTENIAEEIADVEILLEQVKHIYGVRRECGVWKKKKLNKLEGRIEGE